MDKVTFVIPYFRDSKEREENLICILMFLRCNFMESKVIIVESDSKPTFQYKAEFLGVEYIFVENTNGIFYRTKLINTGIKAAKTKYVSIYDTDVIFSFASILQAVEYLDQGASLVYPYSGNFVDIDRSYITNGIIKRNESFASESVGGACFLNREDYMKAGLENENFISWAPEDIERYHRMITLGYAVKRVEGDCYHINHPRGANSSAMNPYMTHNSAEWEKVKEMNKEQLTEYIKTWTW